MSRTIRRRRMRKANPYSIRENSHIAGEYTVVDHYERTGNGHSGYPVLREPTKQERFKLYQRFHLDGHHYLYQGMKPWERRLEQKRHRAKHREKIHRFMIGIDEDIIPEKLPKYPSQYW